MDRKLKRLLIYYGISSFCATAILSGAVISDNYIASLSHTLSQFQTLRVNSVKMKMSTKKMDEVLVKVGILIPPDRRMEEIEGNVLKAADAIKARLKGSDIQVTTLERKDNEVVLPILITGIVGDYNDFIRDIEYVQSLSSPFMRLDSISISRASDEEKERVVFEIRGSLKMQSFKSEGKS